MKRKRKINPRRTRIKQASSLARKVKELARSGAVEEEITQHVGATNKTALRREYIRELRAGRAEKRQEKAAAAAVSKEELALRDHIKKSFASHWFDPARGNLLYGGAMNEEQAFDYAVKVSGGVLWRL